MSLARLGSHTRQRRIRRLISSQALMLLLVTSACRESTVAVETELGGNALGTTWRIIVLGDAADAERADLEVKIAALLESIESQMSHWRENSIVSRFNASESTQAVGIPAQLAEIITEAQSIHEETDGALDISLLPLSNLWGFGPARKRNDLPDDNEIAEALRRVGNRHLVITRHSDGSFTLRKKISGLQIDLSSLGKGFAIDRIAMLLDEHDYDSYLIEFGGELRSRGQSAKGRPWRVGLEAPDSASAGVIRRKVSLEDRSIATSGDYRAFIRNPAGGERTYSHILDPRTGRPVSHALTSVSVIDSSATRADALATALLVLGPQRGYELATQNKIAATFLVRTSKGLEERTSRAFEAFLVAE